MIYDLNNPLHRESFKARCEHLLKKATIVELTEKKKRTLPQNSYLHLILSYFGVETGNTLDYVKEYYFKRLCNPDIFVYQKNDKHIGLVEVLKSSRDVSVEEMKNAISKFKEWALSEAGVFLPDALSKEEIAQMEIEVARNRRYL